MGLLEDAIRITVQILIHIQISAGCADIDFGPIVGIVPNGEIIPDAAHRDADRV